MQFRFSKSAQRAFGLTFTMIAGVAASPHVAGANEFPAVISLATPDASKGLRFKGGGSGDQAGYGVALGDVNGDGIDDLIAGARGVNSKGTDSGSVFVIFGAKSGLPANLSPAQVDGIIGFEIAGQSDADGFGSAVATGDINADGFADVIIGADQAGTALNAGAAYVIYGKGSKFAAKVQTDGMPNTTGFRLDNTTAVEFMGSSVASGDINGDGYDDVLVGARNAGNAGAGSGSVYVIYGKRTRFNPILAEADFDGTLGFRIDGAAASDGAGQSVAAGDVNGDGIDDIIVGANGTAVNGDSFAGAAAVLFGKASPFAAIVSLGSINGSNGFQATGSGFLNQTGSSSAATGDFDGDGIGDMAVGSLGSSTAGGAVVFGRSSAFPASLPLADLDGDTGAKLDVAESNPFLGSGISGAGDVNSDGFADVIVGAQFGEAGDEGASFVVFGSSAAFGATVDLDALDGTNGFKLTGAAAGDQAGLSVSGRGDFNGDGFSDVVVGAPFADAPETDSGAAYVIYGRAPDKAVTRTGSVASQYISGGGLADELIALSGEDELEGRGAGDILKGGGSLDTASYAHAPAGVRADLLNAGTNTGHAQGDVYSSIENLRGSAFGDILLGNDLDNVIIGGKGSDVLTGRGGRDIFRFETVRDSQPGSVSDEIADFDAGTARNSVDRIDLSAIDAVVGPRNDAFSFIGSAPFSKKSGELQAKVSGPDIIVSSDVNGDGKPDLQIRLLNFSNLNRLKAGDFRL